MSDKKIGDRHKLQLDGPISTQNGHRDVISVGRQTDYLGREEVLPMFRLLRLKPPHGWNAVAWELGIVTLGAQQWANDRAQKSQMR